jgi:membrane-bound lytic murein transglycosylase F
VQKWYKYVGFGAVLLSLVSCFEKKQETMVAPWGVVEDTIPTTDEFDLHDIQTSGELIMATVNGPQTYYDYHGHHLGTQFLICQRFADSLGVRLRVEVYRDSMELVKRFAEGEVDIVAWPTPGHIDADTAKNDLAKELQGWYRPELIAAAQKEENDLLTVRKVTRRIFSPMLDAKGGIISHYDQYFMAYAHDIRWDWRLLAAQCYQESTFDPRAVSFAGAKGLMQIMPGTADHLGVSRSKLYEPEANIAAAVKYIAELEQSFSDIRGRSERTKFVLAAYNGGGFHIRDAMALARKHGRDASRWRDVEPFVLGLQRAEYYNDPVVRSGYMRGSETVDYVRKIHERWNGYRGVKTVRSSITVNGTPQKAKRERKKKYQIQAD